MKTYLQEMADNLEPIEDKSMYKLTIGYSTAHNKKGLWEKVSKFNGEIEPEVEYTEEWQDFTMTFTFVEWYHWYEALAKALLIIGEFEHYFNTDVFTFEGEDIYFTEENLQGVFNVIPR